MRIVFAIAVVWPRRQVVVGLTFECHVVIAMFAQTSRGCLQKRLPLLSCTNAEEKSRGEREPWIARPWSATPQAKTRRGPAHKSSWRVPDDFGTTCDLCSAPWPLLA